MNECWKSIFIVCPLSLRWFQPPTHQLRNSFPQGLALTTSQFLGCCQHVFVEIQGGAHKDSIASSDPDDLMLPLAPLIRLREKLPRLACRVGIGGNGDRLAVGGERILAFFLHVVALAEAQVCH